MGTLYNQEVRSDFDVRSSEEVDDFVLTMQRVADRTGVEIQYVIEVAKVMEMRRRNNLYRANGDAWDEQIAGIGEELQKLTEAVTRIADGLESTK